MTIDTYKHNGVDIVKLTGKLDAVNSPKAHQHIIDSTAPGDLALDMRGCDYISSAGLRVLIDLAKKGWKLALVGLNNQLKDVMDVTGFAELFTFKESFDELGAPLAVCSE